MNDWILNQQDEDSSNGIVGDLDKWDDQRIINALRKKCLKCEAGIGVDCIPLRVYEHTRNYQWIHVEREKSFK